MRKLAEIGVKKSKNLPIPKSRITVKANRRCSLQSSPKNEEIFLNSGKV
jgi:hypothetical protein